LHARAIAKHAEAIQAVAAEGALLAGDAAAGRSTRIYTREHSSDLQGAASKEASTLKTARTSAALTPKLRVVTGLATRVSGALKRLGKASRGDQRQLAAQLERAARRSAQIAKSLK
jgi:hypothetical protein